MCQVLGFPAAVPKGNYFDVCFNYTIYYFVKMSNDDATVLPRKVSKQSLYRSEVGIVCKEIVCLPYCLHKFIPRLLSELLVNVLSRLAKLFL